MLRVECTISRFSSARLHPTIPIFQGPVWSIRGSPRYFDRLIANEDSEEEGAEAKEWHKIAVGVDSAAKILIRVCLAAAVAKAVDRSRPWVALAESIADENTSDIQTIRLLIDNADLMSAKDPKERDRKQLKEALEKLDGFETLVKALRKDLKNKLSHLSKGDVPTKEQS